MNKYCVNGFKFQTEEVSRNKKTNNSSVYIQGDVDGTDQTIEYYGVIHEIIEVRYSGWPKKKVVLFRCEWFDPSHRGTKLSSDSESDRHREHPGVGQTKQAKNKKFRKPIDPEDIEGSISSAPERINHDTYLFVVPFGTADPRQYYPNYRRPVSASSTSEALPLRRYEDLPLQAIHQARPLSVGTPSPTGTSPQLSAMRIGDSSSKQLDAMASTPPLTQHFVHHEVSPSSTATPSATPDDTMPTLAPGQKDRLGRVMIEPNGSS
ncbi:hypothetical protein RDI58_010404 [Solanum bulbocastanum]|uniref:DUF4216 domain-containing protein n=1 Tax=Solanum bulbocastanum TaxID=147425 RepID=A0AAN8YJG2_SOLBU